MAKKSTDPQFAHLPNDRSIRITNIISGMRSEKGVEALEKALADGIPLNGLLNFTPAKTFLEYAIHVRNVPVMAYLIDRDHTLVHDQDALLGACLFSKTCTDKLLERGYSFAREMERDSDFFTKHALIMDASYVKDFVSLGGDPKSGVHFQGENGPLIVQAGRFCQAATIGALLDAGADPEARGARGGSFMHGAVTNVRTYADPQYDLASEITRFHGIVEVARRAQCSLELRDEEGRTPLHLAAKMGYVNKVNALLAVGADITAEDENGRTPEVLAKRARKDDVVQVLKACRMRQVILDVAGQAQGEAHSPGQVTRVGREP